MIGWLLEKFGYINADRLRRSEIEVAKLKNRLKAHVDFSTELYFYAGNYPNWKAQQELRQIIQEKGLDSFEQSPTPLDDYLSKIVNETKKLVECDDIMKWMKRSDIYLDDKLLARARGKLETDS